MQFTPQGPDIPDALLQAHEEGRVVFFCGSGISCPAGLPDFKGLVDKIYQLIGTTRTEVEDQAYQRGLFDATLDLLERRLPGPRIAVRRALAKALRPRLDREGAIDTQAALLRLAHSRDGALRLVTTNFDRVFHTAAKRSRQKFREYVAPTFPIPKNSRWNGLVYLHGLLPAQSEDTALRRLVLTSGDFGLAYLTERWAARFVGELFRNYVVCFVGYSIDDPVMRYMMDALAADRMLGEDTPQAWALGHCEQDQEHSKKIEWEAKGVTPILYTIDTNTKDHSVLHRSLHAWAETYIDGVMGKERIVVSHALARPSASTQQDDYVGRMLWALSDKSGLPARRFADFNPVPPLDWLLDAFADARFRESDLVRFGVLHPGQPDRKLRFSIVHRPASHNHTPPMLLSSEGRSCTRWDHVMWHMGRWLVRHLDDPRLIIWIVQQGGQLHDSLAKLIEERLDDLASLQCQGNTAKLNEIRSQAPNAIPGHLMRALWRLLVNQRIKPGPGPGDLYRWKHRIQHDGLTAILRLELRALLEPCFILRPPRITHYSDCHTAEPEHLSQLVDLEIVLTAADVRGALHGFTDEQWIRSLPELVVDFEQLLCDAMHLLQDLGEASSDYDQTYLDLPSVTPHWQNRGFRDWVILVELLRDAWLEVLQKDTARAQQIAEQWIKHPYPIFKRLAFFAASQDSCIASTQWVDWLLADGARWLWCITTRREVCRLLVLQGGQLAGAPQGRLESAILAGPPLDMYPGDSDADRLIKSMEHSVWLNLAKLEVSGLVLSSDAQERLAELSRTNPQWHLTPNEQEEFPHWMISTGDMEFEEYLDIDVAPTNRHDLVQWLADSPPEGLPFHRDTWPQLCRTRFFHCLFALCELASDDCWPVRRWRQALEAWTDGELVLRSWRFSAPLVQTMPDDVIQDVAHSLSMWIKAASKSIDRHEALLVDLCKRILAVPLDASSVAGPHGEPIDQPVTEAMQHPVGRVSQALINLWIGRDPHDNDLLPLDIEPLLSDMCNPQIDRYRHGRVFLGSRLIELFRVDRPWTERHLLPLFSWSNRFEAKGVWAGFLWSPRLYDPLLTVLKPYLLETASFYGDLGTNSMRFVAFLTYAALGQPDGFTAEELRSAFSSLPQDALVESAQALCQALEGAGDQREDYWKNRVQPFWEQVWPKSRKLATPRMAECLARLSVAAGEKFPDALRAVLDWLQPIDNPYYVFAPLRESGLCGKFPEDALRLLRVVIDGPLGASLDLEECLDHIRLTAPHLEHDSSYMQLRERLRVHG